MSGRKQHHIPQMVLRGFAVPSQRKIEQVWVFSKDKTFLSSIEGVGAERHFYSERSSDGTKTLDDLITNYEGKFATLITSLRNAQPGSQVDSRTAAEIVAHLTIRNAHFRRSLSGGMRLLIDGAADLLGNEESLRAMLGIDAREVPEKIATLVREEIAKDTRFVQTGLPSPVLQKVAFMAMKENFSRFVADNVPFMHLALRMLADEAPEITRRGHNQALSTGLSADGRTELLGKLDWSVQSAPAEGVILPDCVALGIERDGVSLPLMLADLKTLTHVTMPLTAHRVLVGCRSGVANPDLAHFNQSAAACSHSFFISHRQGTELDDLVATIGTRSQESVGQAIAAAFEGFRRERQLATDPPAAMSVAAVPGEDAPSKAAEQNQAAPLELNYPVSFYGVADRPTAETIAAVLNRIVLELRSLMPLDRLDGFTFADDYESVLQNLDRGFTPSIPLSTSKPDYGVSVAMTPIVVRDGVAKSHVVARLWIGMGLLSEDDETQRKALHVIVQQLAHVACTQLLDEALPGILLSALDDPYEAFLYPHAENAWSGYFGARASAIIDPSFGGAYRELAVAALAAARKDIPKARLAYRFDGDLDGLLRVALPSVGAILRYTAQLLGHYDGLGQPAFDDSSLHEFEETGLRPWLELFQNDLSVVWQRRGQWNSIEEFLLLNRHAERLLWQFGLFPWKTVEGQIRVEVPLASDAAHLTGIRPALRLWSSRVRKWISRLLKRPK